VTMISKGYMEAHLGTSHKQARRGIQPGRNSSISGQKTTLRTPIPRCTERQNIYNTIEEIPYGLLFYKHFTG
jgi:hypothetical protein